MIAGLPPVPVTVRVEVLFATLPGTFTVSVDDVVAGFGLKVAVAPPGWPLTERVTGELNPPIGLIVTV